MVREERPDFAEKMRAVEGDVAEERLGLGAADRRTLVEEVELVFHLAATTRFDEALRKATLINIRGTREVLQLAKECRRLKSVLLPSLISFIEPERRFGRVRTRSARELFLGFGKHFIRLISNVCHQTYYIIAIWVQ